jgi:hypothetical protein
MAKMSDKKLSVTGLVLGIVAISHSLILASMYVPGMPLIGFDYLDYYPLCAIIGLLCAIIGLNYSFKGKHRCKAAGQPTGMAIAGIVLNILALILTLAWLAHTLLGLYYFFCD